jgi:cytosine/uracil/thiamine/allantoin permease
VVGFPLLKDLRSHMTWMYFGFLYYFAGKKIIIILSYNWTKTNHKTLLQDNNNLGSTELQNFLSSTPSKSKVTYDLVYER